MERSGRKPAAFWDLSSPQTTELHSGIQATGISRSRSSDQISSLSRHSEPESDGALLPGHRLSGSTTTLPLVSSPLLVSKAKGKATEPVTPPVSTPLAKQGLATRITLKLPLSTIPHSPLSTPAGAEELVPSIQIREVDDTEDSELAARRSSQVTDSVQSTDSSRAASPDFLRMQSMLSQFREKRRFSATTDTTPRLSGGATMHQSGSGTPDKKRMQQFLASNFSLRRRSTPAVVPQPETERKSTPPEDEEYLQDLPTICGLKAVLQYPNQGIPEQHLVDLQKTTKVFHMVMSIRPFPKVATAAVLAGCRSKGLEHKEKSTSWGPHVPYLPLQQKYSKLFNEPEEVIARFQAEADKMYGEAVLLKLSPERIEQLKQFTLPDSKVPLIQNVRYEGNTLLFDSLPEKDAKVPFRFRGLRQDDGHYLIQIWEDDHYVPFEIIELIPDYDLGFLYVHESQIDLSQEDKVTIPDVVPYFIQERIARMESRHGSTEPVSSAIQEIKKSVSSMKAFLSKMDKTFGNLSIRMMRYLRVLNCAIDRSPRNPMFHHGPDSHNPVSDPKTNFPLTVVLPHAIGPLAETFYLIENGKQLAAFIKVLKDNDYHTPTNPLWGEETQAVRSEKFTHYSRRAGVPMLPPRHH